jgi:predicted nuclease of restriction endonuclease-like (RecB) superfamily
MKSPKARGGRPSSGKVALPEERSFAEVVEMIRAARGRALAAVNTELVDLYWRVGEYISRKLETATWGEGVMDALAKYIARRHAGLNGFTRANLFRMRRFYETYRTDERAVALVRQLPWSSNLHILTKCSRPEERTFYLRTTIQQRWSVREVARQIDGALFERAMLSPPKVSTVLRQLHPQAEAVFRDAYLVEFLDLPAGHHEADLHQSLLHNKLEFYLEALDRDVRKPHEGPSIGVLLCATKDREVVEYALSRSLSPALVAEYQTRMPDKKLLQAKLHEFYALTET